MTKPLLEFSVSGRPVSVNAGKKNAIRKEKWKEIVHNETKKHYTGTPVTYKTTLKIFYFPNNNQFTDVDNGLKYTIDGMAPLVMVDDRNITRVVAERFVFEPGESLVVPLHLARSIAKLLQTWHTSPKKEYLTLIKLEKYECNGGALW